VTKIALAVPELVDDQSVTIGQAIRNSIMATAGWEVFFLLEFGVLGLVGGTLYFAGKDLLEGSWKHGQLTQTGFELMLAAFTILLASLTLSLLAIVQSRIYLSVRYGAALPLVKAENCEN
jgi:membrane-anchored glycerophosphoryl diester phosphodiesterase (GDPDase)